MAWSFGLPASLLQVLLTRALCLGQLGQQGERISRRGGYEFAVLASNPSRNVPLVGKSPGPIV